MQLLLEKHYSKACGTDPLLHLKGDIVILLLLLRDDLMKWLQVMYTNPLSYFIDCVTPDSEAMKSSEALK